MAQILDGKKIAASIQAEVKQGVDRLVQERGVRPGLAVVRVGDDPASAAYVSRKRRVAQAVGMYSEEHHLPADTSQQTLIELIDRLNSDPKIHGILPQLPLPKGLDPNHVFARLNPDKDVDGFHPLNLGHLLAGSPTVLPCTPAGMMEMLRRSGVDPSGKKAVVVGRSTIVGKPMAVLLTLADATVTVCHSRTPDLADQCRSADILVVAIGRPRLVQGDWVKSGAVVLDVGINRVEDGSLVGDVDFEGAQARAHLVTPVPGGVGPMTVAMLMANTLQAAERAAS